MHPLQILAGGLHRDGHSALSPRLQRIIEMGESGVASSYASRRRRVPASCTRNEPNFSPDGTKILFGCFSFTNMSNDICVMDVNGTNVVDIISTPGLDENFPGWGVAP